MTSYYPGKTLLQESRYLRKKIQEKCQMFGNNTFISIPTFLPEWDGVNTGESPKYHWGDRVRYNGIVYSCFDYAGAEYNDVPASTGSKWFVLSASYPTYDSTATYNAGDIVQTSDHEYLKFIDLKIRSTDGRIDQTSQVRPGPATYLSKIDSNTSPLSDATAWIQIYPKHAYAFTPRPY